MSSISFFENQDALFISCEQGGPLCSANKPREQGLKWAYSLGEMPTDHVVIVGLGSGYHVAALADLDPKIRITVVDSRESLLPVFESQFADLKYRVEVLFIEKAGDILKSEVFKEIMLTQSFVVSFQECWGLQSVLYTEVFAHLTGRSPISLSYHMQSFGFDIKAKGNNSKTIMTIKDALPLIESATIPDQDKQAFRILGELIK
jgi:hypothetical protein